MRCSKTDGGHGYKTVTMLKIIGWYTFSGWIIWYMNLDKAVTKKNHPKRASKHPARAAGVGKAIPSTSWKPMSCLTFAISCHRHYRGTVFYLKYWNPRSSENEELFHQFAEIHLLSKIPNQISMRLLMVFTLHLIWVFIHFTAEIIMCLFTGCSPNPAKDVL